MRLFSGSFLVSLFLAAPAMAGDVVEQKLSSAISVASFDPSPENLEAANALAQSIKNPSPQVQVELSELKLVENSAVLNSKFDDCAKNSESDYLSRIQTGASFSAPICQTGLKAQSQLQKSAEDIKDFALKAASEPFFAEVKETSLRLAVSNLAGPALSLSGSESFKEMVKKDICKSHCHKETSLILEEEAQAASARAQPVKISLQTSTKKFNEIIASYNSSIDEATHIQPDQDPIFAAADKNVALMEADRQLSKALQEPYGQLLFSPLTLRWEESGLNSPAKLTPIKPIDVGLAYQQMAKATAEHIHFLDQVDSQNPAEVQKALKRLIRSSPIAMGQVLRRHPENFDLVCKLTQEVEHEDSENAQFWSQVKTAQVYLDLGSLAAIGVPILGWGGSLAMKGASGTLWGARLLLAGRTAVQTTGLAAMGARAASVGIDGYEGIENYAAYKEGLKAYSSGGGDLTTFLEAQGNLKAARSSLGSAVGMAATAGVFLKANELVADSLKVAGAGMRQHSQKLYGSLSQTVARATQNPSLRQAVRASVSSHRTQTTLVLAAIATLPSAKREQALVKLTKASVNSKGFTGFITATAKKIEQNCSGPCDSEQLSKWLSP